jgi:hypothetical protein
MQTSNKWQLVWEILLGLLFVCLIVSFWLPSGNAYSAEQVSEMKSDNNVRNLVRWVLQYEQHHGGKMPETMKDVAEYSDGLFDFFYPPTPTFPSPTDSITNIDAINAHTGYCLAHNPSTNIPTHAAGYHATGYDVVHKPNTKILVYEKPGLWSDGTVAIGLSDQTVMRLSSKDFAALGLQ